MARDGSKSGGRPKGSKNKATHERLAAIIAGGLTPLEYMLNVMRDPSAEHKRREAMAQASAPYIHPRLTSAEITGNEDKPVVHKLKIEFVPAGTKD